MPPTASSAEMNGFWPPRCTNPDCVQATAPQKAGFFRHGHYTTRLRGKRIPRFLCRFCRRTMSSQTFDVTYRLRRPELEHAIIREIAQGSSLRRVALVLGINRKTVSRRLYRARRQTGSLAPQFADGDGSAARDVADPGSGRKVL